tara:strand:+ start:3698 stop:5074 length:1377 start_codon:yes stop_codon:yes gene_type:complete
MPLIDLVTNLKDLTYGGNGPLITKDIKNPPTSNTLSMEITRRGDDLVRIGKLLTTAPGIKHGINQVALNAVERRITAKNETGLRSIVGGGWSAVKGIASTLAQVPVNGTGTHFVEGFGGKRGYLKSVQGHVDYKIPYSEGGINTKGILEKTGEFETKGSILTAFTDLPLDPKSDKVKDTEYYEPSDFTNEKGFKYVAGTSEGQNARAHTIYKQNKLGFQAVGTEAKFGEIYWDDVNFVPLDRVTAKFPSTGSATETSTHNSSESFFEDIIDFRFKVITPQISRADKPIITTLDFRAYLDSFNDSFTGDWSSINYLGRAETFYSYTGFNRAIAFSFKVAASSIDEMKPLYEKLNLLVGTTAPTYRGKNYMRGTHTAVTVGGYIKDQPGFIQSISLDWNNEYPWHTNAHEGNSHGGKRKEEAEHKQLPTVLDVSIVFQPIHTEVPSNSAQYIGAKNDIEI